MKKSDKKFENELVKSLTVICEYYKSHIDGFSWLTHTINFSDINNSLSVTCIFENNQQLVLANRNQQNQQITDAIIKAVTALNIKIKNKKRLVKFDSEENCQETHQGNWQKRLQQVDY